MMVQTWQANRLFAIVMPAYLTVRPIRENSSYSLVGAMLQT
jgi:hypothetical protein